MMYGKPLISVEFAESSVDFAENKRYIFRNICGEWHFQSPHRDTNYAFICGKKRIGPYLKWDDNVVIPLLTETRHGHGRLLGRMEALGFELRRDAVSRTLSSEIIKTSEIEGEILDVEQVRSSVARRLGIKYPEKPSGRKVDAQGDGFLLCWVVTA